MKQIIKLACITVTLTGPLSCTSQKEDAGTSTNGSIAVTRDDALLYAAESDTDSVYVIDVGRNEKVAEIRVGAQPDKVLMASDDTVYVTNRMGRSVSILRRGDTDEFARIAVGVEPSGMALSRDNKTLYVVNAASLADPEVGSLMAIDTASRSLKWELPVGADARAVTLLAGGKAMVSLNHEGTVVLVDVDKASVVTTSNDAFAKLNGEALGLTKRPGSAPSSSPARPPGNDTGPKTARFRGGNALIASADGQQVYMSSRLATDTTLATRQPTSSSPSNEPRVVSGSGYSNSGTCGGSKGASAAAIVTFSSRGEAQVDDLQNCSSAGQFERPAMLPVGKSVVQGPSAMALDTSGSFLFVANFESNNVMVVATSSSPTKTGGFEGGRDVPFPGGQGSFFGNTKALIPVGAGPSGIALSNDGKKAWVFNAFDHSVTTLAQSGNEIVATNTLKVGADVLSGPVVEGRKLFFSAVDNRMSNPLSIGMACGTCHERGREDGHVWNFVDGPRQTPSLAGKHTMDTAPFHWNGEFDSLTTFMAHTVKERMGGQGVTLQMEQQLAAYIRSIPAPDNAAKEAFDSGTLARGEAVFQKAQCNSCHTGVALTDNKFYDVGSYVTSGQVPDNAKYLPQGLNTPSLIGISHSAPYLHDGSAPTLKLRILQGKEGNQHGLTANLSETEVDDLVAYVKSL